MYNKIYLLNILTYLLMVENFFGYNDDRAMCAKNNQPTFREIKQNRAKQQQLQRVEQSGVVASVFYIHNYRQKKLETSEPQKILPSKDGFKATQPEPEQLSKMVLVRQTHTIQFTYLLCYYFIFFLLSPQYFITIISSKQASKQSYRIQQSYL